MLKARDVRIPADAPPMVTQAEVARWFGVARAYVPYWRDRGLLGPWVRVGATTVLYHTDHVRRFAAQVVGARIDGEAQEKAAKGNDPGVIL